jgi:hypothetical protein
MIKSPADRTFYRYSSDLIIFTATAQDATGASLAESAVTWSSDIDGVLGSGLSLQHALSGGLCGFAVHNVTAKAIDLSGKTAADSVVVYVGQIC